MVWYRGFCRIGSKWTTVFVGSCRNMFGDRRRILLEIVLFGERNCYEGSKRNL